MPSDHMPSERKPVERTSSAHAPSDVSRDTEPDEGDNGDRPMSALDTARCQLERAATRVDVPQGSSSG
jgi:hypothetical protein